MPACVNRLVTGDKRVRHSGPKRGSPPRQRRMVPRATIGAAQSKAI